MIYYKITEEIRNLLNKLTEVKERKVFLGCRSYCSLNVIASDELELMKKLLKNEGVDLSLDEFNKLRQNTESAYFRNIHICEDKSIKKLSDEERKKELESEVEELLKDKVPNNKKYLFEAKTDIFELDKERQHNESKPSNGQQPSYVIRESTMSYGVNLLVSFFLIIFGSYALCKYIFEMSDSTTFKVSLVVSIVVMFAEAILLLLKLEKESNKEINLKGLKKSSFAYKFNKSYRQSMEMDDKKKKTKKE